MKRNGIAFRVAKSRELMRLRREPRSDDPHAHEPPAQQQGAAHEKRLDEHLPELRDFVDGSPQLAGAHLDDLAVFLDASGDERAAAREHVDVAGELAGKMHANEPLLAARMLHDCDRALYHDVEAEIAVALGEQDVAGANGA